MEPSMREILYQLNIVRFSAVPLKNYHETDTMPVYGSRQKWGDRSSGHGSMDGKLDFCTLGILRHANSVTSNHVEA